MRRHSAKPLFKHEPGVWDLGGGTNECDSPSEIPVRDCLVCENWRVHPDGRTKVKRGGYTKFDPTYDPLDKPIRQVVKFRDGNGIVRTLVITENSVVSQKDVYGYTLKLQDTDTAYRTFNTIAHYQGKLVIADKSSTPNTMRALQSTDGEAWTELFSYLAEGNGDQCGLSLIEFNNKLFMTLYATGVGSPRVIAWNGVSVEDHLTAPSQSCYGAFGFQVWDGRLWVITAWSPSEYQCEAIVHHYNGTAWSAITNYDAASFVSFNTPPYKPNDNIAHRLSRLFVWNNELYLFVSVYNPAKSKWRWKVLKFNAATYDKFTTVYDSASLEDDYVFTGVAELNQKIYVIGNKLQANGTADKPAKLYASEDMATWTSLGEFASLGFVFGEAIFDSRLYISTVQVYTGNEYGIYYFDRINKIFTLEQSISAESNVVGGDLLAAKNTLWAGKYREVYKRVFTANLWTDIYTTETPVIEPPPKTVAVDGERLILGIGGQNVVIEGDKLYTLGIVPPVTTPSVAGGTTGILIGEYKYAVTFRRSGNYPVESNPSPVSALVTVGSPKPETAPSVQVGAAGGLTGLYYYKVTFITAVGETEGSIISEGAIADAQKINLSKIPLGGSTVTGRKIYRTKTDGSAYFLVTTINDNTTETYEDNIADASLGAEVPTENTTGQKVNLTNIPTSSDAKVNQRRIYRTTAGGAILQWLADLEDNTTAVLEDNFHDDELGDEISYDRGVPPKGDYFEIWDNRLWIASGNFLFFTNTGTAEEWGSLNFLQIQARDSAKIANIKAFGDILYALKDSPGSPMFSVETVGESLYKLNQLPIKCGLRASHSLTVCDKLMMWLSFEGIEAFNGQSIFRPILSRYVKRTLDSINKDYLYKIVGGYFDRYGEYWMTIPTGTNTECNKTVVFDSLKNVFYTFSFAKGVSYLYPTKDLTLLLGTPDGYVLVNESGTTDDGTAINATFRTGWLYITGEREMWNIIRRMFLKYILPAGKTLVMKIYLDFSNTAAVTVNLAGSTPASVAELRNEIMARINLGVRGYYASFEFSNNEDAGGECRVVGWDLFFRKRVWKQTVKA